MAKCNQK